MKREQIMQAVQKQMPEKRWQHTLGVMETAVRLAKRYGADSAKADLAAIVHDVAKYWPIEQQREALIRGGLSDQWLKYDKPLWHAPIGALVAKKDYGIEDEEILDAIRYHTSGRERMTLLDKVVCLADYIEPGRDFPEVEKLRALAEESLEKALVAGFDSTMVFLISQGRKIFPLTLMARNDLIDEIRR